MAAAPTIGVPELAGIATYEDAAQIGYSVEENVRRLLRLHWVERRMMAGLVAHLPATPEWEVKCGLALHQWQDAEHADALRRRIAEMRNPVPRLDEPPDGALDALLEETLRSRDTVELLAGSYGVVRRALAEAYRDHWATTNPLVDHPTRRLLRFALLEEEEALQWAERALAALVADDPSARERALAWQRHLRAYLDAAGGIAGERTRPLSALPLARATTPFVPDFHPGRDDRFHGLHAFDFPPHVVFNEADVPADERNLALLCKRTLEMDVPEMMASFLSERTDQPWQFYLDYSRQLWDECRHAMMGTVAFEAKGVDWTAIPLNIGFALRLNLHATPVERQILLFAIEQSLMPDTGKRAEYETALAAGDALSAHFHDYDWADEVLHAQIGRRLLKREGISVREAIDRATAVHEKTWAALDAHRVEGEQREWWGEFVERVLGKPSAAKAEMEGVPRVLRAEG